MVRLDYQDNIALLKLNRGITNAINSELIKNISDKLSIINSDSNIKSLVLTSENQKFFERE